MQSVNLKKILLKGEILMLLRGLVTKLTAPIAIQDPTGKVLVADLGIDPSSICEQLENIVIDIVIEDLIRAPILLDDQILGWVVGKEQVQEVANFLSYIVKREFEQKALAADSLDKYREINLLYTIASKMSQCLDVEEIGELVIEEASRLIRGTSASVMLYNPKNNCLEVVSRRGTAKNLKRLQINVDEGIAGYVFSSGRPEIVNDVIQDSRYVANENECYAIICAPILTKSRTIGVVNISNSDLVSYTSQDLKLFTAIVTQASGAIENALLHQSRLQQQRIKNNLERYLSPQVAEAVINEKEEISLTTSKRTIAMLFSDIRNFTTKCEELEPEQLVSYLNEYFTQMVDVIFSHQGTVNKFVGDMIVAMFGAPSAIADREYWAIAAAINMQQRIKNLPIEWIRDNFVTGIGISSGDVIVGNIGSPQHMDYTAIGDEMNIASRLQGLAQGGQILVTRSVYDATKDAFEFKEFGTITVKGKKNLVEVFEVIYE
jgi:adenylate cyclase